MQIIGRILLLVLGALFFLDATLPLVKQQVVVNGRAMQGGKYRVDFLGKNLNHCVVGPVTANALTDGESVSLTTTPIWNSCALIAKEDGTTLPLQQGRWYSALLGLILLAGGIGWLRSEAGSVILYRR